MKSPLRKWLGLLLVSALGLAAGPGRAASYAPLDCAKATTAAEIAVCKSYALGQDEARLATLYGIVISLVAMGQKGDIVDSQRRWVAAREACASDAECLSRTYRTRIQELTRALDEVEKRGPF
jgi:uncharacterized protein